MSDPVWSRPFPGGVADASGRHALLRDAAGRCALLRLSDGQLLWRSAEPLRPLLVDDRLAVALAMAPPRESTMSSLIRAVNLLGCAGAQSRARAAARTT